MRPIRTQAVVLSLVLSGLAGAGAAEPAPPSGVRRVVFLGDSITYSGQYVADVEAYLRLKDPANRLEFLNLGLPSETASGLSEPGHAGGSFPRPDLHERLDRVLKQTKPDLVVAMYGMNDGIYHPFSESRFRAYRDGIARLRAQAAAAGAKVLHLTPPVFDPVPLRGQTLPAGLPEYAKPYEGYDDVLDRYARWLLGQKKAEGWDVVDVHGPMARFLAAQRERDPGYRLAGDGVHSNDTGHWIIAREVLRHWGAPARDLGDAAGGPAQAFAAFPHGPDVLKLVGQRQRLLKDAWLSATGHKRPGMAPGLPLAEAQERTADLDATIRARLSAPP